MDGIKNLLIGLALIVLGTTAFILIGLFLSTRAGEVIALIASLMLWAFVCYILGEHLYNWQRGKK